jgi:DNA-binding transcriptional MerR regulator/methylmalonyl-CoA mutase cobalamin-binding subunit
MKRRNSLPIRVVSRKTGLSPHVIRAWERRYNAVVPVRSQTNRRLYSEADVEKLNLLQSAISSGHSIGRIASLPVDEIRRLIVAEPPQAAVAEERRVAGVSRHLESCIEAVKQLDETRLEAELGRAGVALGQVGLTQQVIAPLLDCIGNLWRDGELRVAQEHMASAAIRSVLGVMRESFETGGAPRIIVTTPAGHLHEFGALLAANAATWEGWRVTYLGPNLPSAEIAGAVLESGARAVALSLVYPARDSRVVHELKELRRLLGNGVTVLVGGRASGSYAETLQEIAAIRAEDLNVFRSELDSIR